MMQRPTPEPGERKQRRKRLLLWSALPAAVALCLSAKLLSLGILAGAAERGFAAGDARSVADAAAGLDIANVIEPHKAPFAAGDSLVLAGDFAGARQRFEEALPLAGAADGCIIRVNLVLSIERLGDQRVAAEDATAAARLFAEGLAVVDSAPESCFPAGGSGGSGGAATGAGGQLDQAAERLKQKADDAAGGGATPQPAEGQPAPSDPGRESQLEQLQESSRESQRERNTGQERDEYLRDDDYGSGPDRPW
ncbi:hypothetical protein [Pseudarthrobacter sp. DSP2-3-2b1]|uniref:hypothetical protein n=1 Tax=Pseudarthrobacter sp. DSP2-3-2b1 TaxID=2804661 RepID=UPI003CEB3661